MSTTTTAGLPLADRKHFEVNVQQATPLFIDTSIRWTERLDRDVGSGTHDWTDILWLKDAIEGEVDDVQRCTENTCI